jgi:hypothetical protein
VDYIQLWDLISVIELQPEIGDKHVFNIAADGIIQLKLCIMGFFSGSTSIGHYKRVWKT